MINRLFIYPKDIVLITGKSERQCRAIILTIKKHYQKEKHQLLKTKEYCEYMGVDIEEIEPFLK